MSRQRANRPSIDPITPGGWQDSQQNINFKSLMRFVAIVVFPSFPKEWTGLEWNIILRKAKSREELRKMVVESTVVPPNGQPDYEVDKIR